MLKKPACLENPYLLSSPNRIINLLQPFSFIKIKGAGVSWYLFTGGRIYGVVRRFKYALYACAPSVLYLRPPASRYRRICTNFLRGYVSCSKKPERYRSGHNGGDSKSSVRPKAYRGFESHPLRHFFCLFPAGYHLTRHPLTASSINLPAG